jgi:predicted unusual protein kinase regulating ubiquinone biosynthesis (AarF/ABC1/UbiB family)
MSADRNERCIQESDRSCAGVFAGSCSIASTSKSGRFRIFTILSEGKLLRKIFTTRFDLYSRRNSMAMKPFAFVWRVIKICAIFMMIPILLLLHIFRHRMFPRALKKFLIVLGPVYIKLGQVLSTRRDFIPEPLIAELATLCNDVPVVPFSRIRATLQRAFPNGVDAVFTRFNPQALAAGAVAQVYRADLPNGDRVAVKVLRPGIRSEIQANFRVIRGFARLLEFFSRRFRSLNVTGMVEELYDLLLAQSDLSIELRHYQEFAELFHEGEGVVVPRVYPILSTSDVLVMEFIEGIKPYDVHMLDVPPLELVGMIDHLFDSMIFLKGACHADLHPGNFFWTRDARIVLIDLGLVCHIEQRDSMRFITLYYSILDGFYDFAGAHFARYFLIPGPDCRFDHANSTDLHGELTRIIRAEFIDSGGKPSFGRIFRNLTTVAIHYGLQLKAIYSKLFLTAITLEGYLYTLDPSFDMLENSRKKRLDQAQYTSIPEEGERIILGESGTYSTAMFQSGAESQQAFQVRDAYIADQLELGQGKLFIDVGCGRGRLLMEARKRGARAVGITISSVEHDLCSSHGMECVLSSWEDFDRCNANFPRADAISAVEMFNHLGTLPESRDGLVALRLNRFFDWTRDHLHPDGRVFVQSLVVGEDLLHDERLREQFNRIDGIMPFAGFSTAEQIINSALRRFRVVSMVDHSEDLLPTYYYIRSRVDNNEVRLRNILGEEIFSFVKREADLLIEMAEQKLLGLVRMVLVPR